MKPDYKNWIPKGMLVSLIAGTVLSLALLLVFGVFGIGAFPMTASASSQSRSSKEPRIMSPCRRAALGWMWAAAAVR